MSKWGSELGEIRRRQRENERERARGGRGHGAGRMVEEIEPGPNGRLGRRGGGGVIGSVEMGRKKWGRGVRQWKGIYAGGIREKKKENEGEG